MKQYRFARSLEFGTLFEHFFLSAVVTIILIRIWLHLTGYPQLGGDELHIAHMLWGGLLLVLSLLGSLLFLNNDLKNVWAVVGGAGFGAFLDEVGKFVTKDNNYFYQPTFAIMYAIFVGLYVLFRSVWHKRSFSPEEYLLNSIEGLKKFVTETLHTTEIEEMRHYLSLSDIRNPVAEFVQSSLEKITGKDPRRRGVYQRLRLSFPKLYKWLARKKWFLWGIVVLLLVRAGVSLVEGGTLVVHFLQMPFGELLTQLTQLRGVLPFLNMLALLVQAGLTIAGATVIWRSRLKAYRLFRSAILVSLLFLQVFHFYDDPIMAFSTTIRDILLLLVMEYLIAQEDLRNAKHS